MAELGQHFAAEMRDLGPDIDHLLVGQGRAASTPRR